MCGGTPASEGGREDTSCNEQMSPGPKQQAGGLPQGERDVEGPTLAFQPGEPGRKAMNLILSELSSAPLSLQASSPSCSPFDSTIR